MALRKLTPRRAGVVAAGVVFALGMAGVAVARHGTPSVASPGPASVAAGDPDRTMTHEERKAAGLGTSPPTSAIHDHGGVGHEPDAGSPGVTAAPGAAVTPTTGLMTTPTSRPEPATGAGSPLGSGPDPVRLFPGAAPVPGTASSPSSESWNYMLDAKFDDVVAHYVGAMNSAEWTSTAIRHMHTVPDNRPWVEIDAVAPGRHALVTLFETSDGLVAAQVDVFHG